MSKNSQHLPIGYKIGNHYEITEVLGQGGFGIVYLVKDTHRIKDNIFIVKELFIRSDSFRHRGDTTVGTSKKIEKIFEKIKEDIREEVNILSSIENKNIVQAYGYIEENNTIYSIMEHIEGIDLEEYIKENPFDEEQTMDLLEQIINGLKEIHTRNIIHRDIKPSNIMRTQDGIYKIIDFTTNKTYSDNETTITNINSQGYTPPELLKTKAVIGDFCDIYSIGMTLYKVLSLKNPPTMADRFDDSEFQESIDNLDISYGFREIIRKMTTKEVEDRFGGLGEIELFLNKKNGYLERMSVFNPGCIIVMIEQSLSMNELYNNDKKKKDLIAYETNTLINYIIEANIVNGHILNTCFIVVIGYGDKNTGVDLILGDMISNIAENPLRVEKIKKKISDGAGGLIEIDEDFPIWVEPKADWDVPMDLAFKRASQLAQAWCDNHPDSLPPIVINIMGSEPNNIDNSKLEAKNLKNISNNNGNVLLLNACIDNSLSDSIKFPSRDSVDYVDILFNFIFDISSLLPDIFVKQLQKCGFNITLGAKGVLYNADVSYFLKMIDWYSWNEMNYDDMKKALNYQEMVNNNQQIIGDLVIEEEKKETENGDTFSEKEIKESLTVDSYTDKFEVLKNSLESETPVPNKMRLKQSIPDLLIFFGVIGAILIISILITKIILN